MLHYVLLAASLTARSKFPAACVRSARLRARRSEYGFGDVDFSLSIRAALSVRLLQVGLRLHDFGPRPAVGEFDELGVVAARAGGVAHGSCGGRCAGVAAQSVIGVAQRGFETFE